MNLEHASYLDCTIARLTAQRDHLAAAAVAIRDLPGPVLEIGLGKGRTYDHLRRLFPERDIYAFDASVHAPASRVPDAAHLFVGEFRNTLMAAANRLSGLAVLAHADFGSDDRVRDAAQAEWLGPQIDRLMALDGIVLSDRALSVERWVPIDSLPGDWPYFMWRVGRSID